jgi:hypothetical protein
VRKPTRTKVLERNREIGKGGKRTERQSNFAKPFL